MVRKAKEKSGFIQYPIEGELTIFVAEGLREIIIPAIAENNEIEIDLSRVSDIDAAGMQLMVSAKLEAILRGKTLRYVGHSQSVLEMIDLCNLGEFFGDQVIIQSEAAH